MSLLVAFSPARTIMTGVAVLVAVALLKVVGEHQLELTLRWRRGREAEKSVGEELNPLRREGFVVMHGVPQRCEGIMERIVSGRTGTYLVETRARGYEREQ